MGLAYCEEQASQGGADASKELKTTLARQLSRRHVLKDGYNTNLEVKEKEVKTATNAKLAGWKHFTAGAVAGACEVIGTMPLDVAKTQMQINPKKYTGPINCMATIARTSGFRGLYFGMPAFLIQTSGKAAIRFTAFAKVKDGLSLMMGDKTVKDNPVFFDFLAGLCAGAAEAALWTTPTERLKVLKQAEAGSIVGASRHQTLLMSARTCIADGGVSNLFVGLVPCVIRQASSVGIRFMLYAPVKKVVNHLGGDNGSLTNMAAGGTVGALSVILNNPVDVIKNIAQSGKTSSLGTMAIARKVYSENGVMGFFRGLSARVPRVFGGQAITFAAYEKTAELLIQI